jgi:tRNA A-37 threonylcarbamoyl transferase component Bud32
VSGKAVSQNLIVMPKALGVRLTDWMGLAVARGQTEQIVHAVEELGRDLRGFHEKYKTVHADFQPSNIFFGRLSGVNEQCEPHNVFIDIGGIGTAVGETDQVHFTKALELLGKAYGQDFVDSTQEAFMKGYNGQ